MKVHSAIHSLLQSDMKGLQGNVQNDHLARLHYIDICTV